MLVLEWEYLSGRACARAYNSGQNGLEPEWPPHPDRVFQALVAAWGSLGEPHQGTEALRWIESQDDPEIFAPDVEFPEPQGVFVPVNDPEGSDRKPYGEQQLKILPSFRKRVQRSFPSVLLPQHGSDSSTAGETATCALIWKNSQPGDYLLDGLRELCSAVTNIGHSSSFVRMQVGSQSRDSNWVPSENNRSDAFLRIPGKGRLDSLCAAYANGGKNWRRPPVGQYRAYRRIGEEALPVPVGHFDPRLVIFRLAEKAELSLIQTLAFSRAIRAALLSRAGEDVKELVSGHNTNGEPTLRPHFAYLPLPFVDAKHADGHLLGFAIALPRTITLTEEEAFWHALSNLMDMETETLRIVAGPAGAFTLLFEERPAPPFALRGATWCRPSICWNSTTPVVLDRLPPRRHKDHDRWAVEQISESCLRQGFPTPSRVSVSAYSYITGVPPARSFPALQRKDGLKRWHVHTKITFPSPVSGPLILGSGRFWGYGFFKPDLSGDKS